jgi:asparagine synthase (glutamine-hydrolysing)
MPWLSASAREAAGDGALPFDSIDEAAEWVAGYLGVVFAEIAAAFPGRISAALSGGFDSRLIVAGLLSRGERPRLFVYGGPNSVDVSIARQVARGEGLCLDEIDKVAINRQLPALNLDGLVESALFFDGLPNDGIDDPGADRSTRLAQNAEHRIAINGGGGEIFRNFFHLPDRRYRAHELVRVFYRGFDATLLRDHAHLAAYEARLARSILSALGLQFADRCGNDADDPSLSRAQVELAYPLFRCHHWMGVNNSVALRYGYFCTPLVDRQTMSVAAALPLRWKNAGDLEARVIARLNRAVAAHASAYGFRFTEGPDRRARLSEALTCVRPVIARPAINALHRRLRNARPSPGLLRRYRDLLPGEWRLDPLVQLDRLTDPEALARALAVEIVARELV